MTSSIFMQIHTERSGKSQPIASMSDEHLLNYIKFMLLKLPAKKLNNFKEMYLSGYAPEDMPENQRHALGLKKLTTKIQAEALEAMEEQQDDYLAQILEHITPYLIAAFCRDSIYMEVRQILIDITGLTQRVDLPTYTVYPTMTQDEYLELSSGDAGYQGGDDEFSGFPMSEEDQGDWEFPGRT